MKKQTGIFSLCFLVAAWLGLWLGNATVTPTAQAGGSVSSVMAAPACAATVNEVKIQRNPGGNDFSVSWRFPSRCQQSTEVALTVIKLSGAERTDRKKKESGITIANFNFAGDGDLNPIKKARATITSSGVLAAKNSLTVNLGFGSDKGSSGPAPVAASTISLRGSVKNGKGVGIGNIKIAFAPVKGGNVTVPDEVKTNQSGNFQQDGFQSGVKFRVTPSRPGFTFNPPVIVAGPGTPLEFTAIAEPGPVQPVTPFSVSGTVLRVNQTAIAGALVSFRIISGGNGTQVPNPVSSNQNGSWSQTGFTPGVTYEANVTKQGFSFSPNVKTFNAANSNLNFSGLPR